MTRGQATAEVWIDAPPELVWEVVCDVESWPRWMSSMTRVQPLDRPGLAVGHRFRVKQPGTPALVWSVTDVLPVRRWSWEQRTFGGSTAAVHEITVPRRGGTRLCLVVRHRGPVRGLVGALTAARTRRFMELEADALKSVSEQRTRNCSST